MSRVWWPRVTPAGTVLVVSLGVLVAVPVAWAEARPAALAGDPLASAAPAPDAERTAVRREVRPAAPTSNPGQGSRPVQLRVAALGATASVVPVGVAPDGQVDLPDDGDVVGWYRFGPRPGDNGSAVLVAHRDTLAAGPGVLFDLPQVEPGDRIQVGLANGSSLWFQVVARESIDKGRLPLDRLFARDGRARLTVVTCGGAYLPDRGGYQENIVVTAVPVSST